ncbi:glycosyltransferase family 4 protein [Clostridium transplantifaecale]|uniref:glycosyltransferase family 4 protein n=1 Tax=Clostridium transplantifaecale TaxID=2479838 RepID=UPI000F643406|nr:glycosyltransferase family 4 protein [Clostridium transplantifaecale]
MNILIISQRFFPETFRINDIAKDLVKRGHKVTVLTGLPNYPSGNISERYCKFKNRKEYVAGVEIIRTYERGRKNGIIGLGLNYLSLAVSSSWKALFLKGNYDVIYVYQLSPVFVLLPARIMKFRKKIPVLIYCCDLWPESLKAYNIKEKNLLFQIIKKICYFLYSGGDMIAVTSKTFIEYFHSIHHISIPIYYMPQHAEESYLNMELSSSAGEEIQLLFCGNIGRVQDMPCALKAMKILNKNLKVHLHIVGDGSELEASKKMVKEFEIDDRVTFYGRYPLKDMPDFYKMADACLLTLTGDNFIGATIPSKLQGYMAAGKMVLAAIDGAAKEIIEESHCGMQVAAGDYQGLANIIEEFVLNRCNYASCGEAGRAYFKRNFTKDIFMKELLNQFEKLKET